MKKGASATTATPAQGTTTAPPVTTATPPSGEGMEATSRSGPAATDTAADSDVLGRIAGGSGSEDIMRGGNSAPATNAGSQQSLPSVDPKLYGLVQQAVESNEAFAIPIGQSQVIKGVCLCSVAWERLLIHFASLRLKEYVVCYG